MALLVNTSNVKVSTNVANLPDGLERIRSLFRDEVTSWGNFFVRRSNFTYIIFLNGHINITGIRSFGQFEAVLDELSKVLGLRLPPMELRLRVDNICSSGRTPLIFLPLQSLEEKLKEHLKRCYLRPFIERLDYQPDKFPALYLKTKIGCILLFNSGKFVLVGYKRLLDGYYLSLVIKHALGLETEKENEQCNGNPIVL